MGSQAAHRNFDELCAQLILSEEDEPGQQCEQREELISLTRSTHSPAQTTRDCKVVSSR
jgi:hypothetical protein